MISGSGPIPAKVMIIGEAPGNPTSSPTLPSPEPPAIPYSIPCSKSGSGRMSAISPMPIRTSRQVGMLER